LKRAKGISARLKSLEKLLRDKRPRSALELACINRQKNDLDEGHKRGLQWDEDAAQRAVNFFPLLRHWKGKWAGTPMTLESYQEHLIIAPLFGWKQEATNLRRFRTGYVEQPRKQGKTTIGAGIALQGLVADQEPGAEVYAAATKRDQACILFNDSKRCLGPQLKQKIKQYQFSLTFDQLNGSFQPLSADHDSLDGLNIHRAVIDELHAHKERGLWDVLLGSVGARSQPLVIAITTAGDDDKSICGEVRNQLAIPAISGEPGCDDAFFTFISCADIEDDWQDPQTWLKANPNLGVSLNIEFLENLCRQARASKASENNFRRKHLNQWITGASEWLAPAVWASCKSDEEPNLDGKECFIGVDIGTRDDFAAVGRLFPERIVIPSRTEQQNDEERKLMDDGSLPEEQQKRARFKIRSAYCDVTLWVPENGRRDIREAPLVNWIDRGLVNVAGGSSTDFDAMLDQIVKDSELYDVRQIAIDPNNARQFGSDLVELGFEVFNFTQNTRNYHEPMEEFASLVKSGNFKHPGHDVLSWMIGNVRIRSRNGYMMPWKEKCPDKIDGAVSLLMATGVAMFCDKPVNSGKFYETHELEFI